MPLSFAFESFGDQVIQRTLLGIRDRSRDLRPAFQLIRRDFIGIEKRQFATEGARASAGWPALKPETIRRKAARGRNRGMLRENDDLFKSLTVMSNANNHYEATRNSVRMWTSDPKARIHQKGAPKVHLPQRRVVDLTEADKQRWVKTIQAHVLEREGSAAREVVSP